MAIAFVAASAVATGSTSLSIAMPAGTTQNHIMIMVVGHHNTATTPAPPGDWNKFVFTTSTAGYAFMAWKRAGGSEAGPYSVTGVVNSCAGAIMSFSGCRQVTDPTGGSASRANASGATGTPGLTTAEANEMVINAGFVLYNYSFTSWSSTDPASYTERFDGRTTTGLRCGVGGSSQSRTTAGATGATSYVLATNYENIGLCCALLPQTLATLTMANGAHAHTADNTSITNQNSTLAMANCSHVHAASVADTMVEHKTLAVAGAAHAVTSSVPTPVHNIVAIALTYFYTWIVAVPAIGGIPGPKLCVNHDVQEISSYTTAATSAVFNIEERSTIGSAGTNILASDQTANITGASATSFDNTQLAKDNHLWLDISGVTGTPGYLMVTIKTTITYNLQMENAAHVVSSPTVALTQAHTLAVASDSHAVTSGNISLGELKTLAMANCAHGVTSSVPTLTENAVTVYADVPGFWTWIISDLTVGGVPGPKSPQRVNVKELQSYTTAGNYVDFNIEERDTIGSAGTNILASDQRALPTGAVNNSFLDSVIAPENQLWLDISAVSGTPGFLMVTLIYEKAALQAADSCSHAVTSSNIDLVEHKTLAVNNAEHVVASVNITIGGHEGTLGIEVPEFYCWVIDAPVVGAALGPKIPVNLDIQEVSSYIVGGTSVTFNIESRTTPNAAGTNILVSDQVSSTTGQSATGIDFTMSSLIAGRWLLVDISGAVGSPSRMTITLAARYISPAVDACSHAVTSDNITLSAITGVTLAVANCSHAHTVDSPIISRKLSASTTMTLIVTPVILGVANCSHAVTTSAITFVAGTTRIYLPSSGVPSIYPDPAWVGFDEVGDADQLVAVFEKGTTARTEKTMTVQNYATTTYLNRQYALGDVHGLTAHNFTTAETFTLVVQCEESNALANATLAIDMTVWDITGTSSVGSPYNGVVNVTEFVQTTPTSRYCTKNFTSNVNMSGGSLLTIGFGASCALTEGSPFTIGMMFGDAPSTALSLNNSDTGADYPYVEFPFLLSFYSMPLTVASATHGVTSSVPVLGTGLLMNNAQHDITSPVIDLAGVSSTLTVANCTHAVTSSVINLPAPPGRRLYIKVEKHWLKIAPEGA